jgi:WhiB family redox-sensing transcriptional regulator
MVIQSAILEPMKQAWRSRGACLNSSPDLFFPIGQSEKALEQEQEAIAICNSCVVKNECLNTALTLRKDFGIWGGMTEHERKLIIKRYDAEIKKEKKRAQGDKSFNGASLDIIEFYDSLRHVFEQHKSPVINKARIKADADLENMIESLDAVNETL